MNQLVALGTCLGKTQAITKSQKSKITCSCWPGGELCFLSLSFWDPGCQGMGMVGHCLDHCWLLWQRERRLLITYWLLEFTSKFTVLLQFCWPEQITWGNKANHQRPEWPHFTRFPKWYWNIKFRSDHPTGSTLSR